MAGELKAYVTSGKTLYAVLLSSAGMVWNGASWEAYAGANWATYKIALTEAGAGIYLAMMPAVASGIYSYAVYEQAGVNPATTDTLRGTGSIGWNGTAEILPVNVTQWVGTSTAAGAIPAQAAGAANGLVTVDATGLKVAKTVDLTAGQSIAASSVPNVVLANGAHGGAGTTITLQTPIVATISGTLTTLDAVWAKIQKWLRLALRKDSAVATDHATELAEINANGGSGAGAYANTTDSQEGLRDTEPMGTAMRGTDGAYTGTPPTAAAVADQVWDEAVADHTGATTFGGKLQTAVSTPPTAAAVADQVWDEAVADHTGATTFGGKLQTAVSTPPTAAAVADAVWDELSTGHTDTGKAGEQLWTDIDAIKAKTDLLASSTATVVAPVVGTKHNITIGATFSTTVTGLTISATWTKMLYTLKNEVGEDDDESILQVQVSNPAAAASDGTLYVEATAATAAQRVLASLTVDQAAGTVAIALGATLLADLAQHGDAVWDIKEIGSTGQNVRGTGTADVSWAVTHATS